MTDIVTYEEHKAFLIWQVSAAVAEHAGFCGAQNYEKMWEDYSPDSRVQARYEQGFQDGKAMLLAGKEMAT